MAVRLRRKQDGTKIDLALIDTPMRKTGSSRQHISGKPGAVFNAGRCAAIDIAGERRRQSGFSDRLAVSLQPAVEGARELLQPPAHADIADALLAKRLFEPKEQPVHERPGEIVAMFHPQPLERQPGVQDQNVKPAVERVRHAQRAKKHRFAGTRADCIAETVGGSHRQPARSQRFQHAISQEVAGTCNIIGATLAHAGRTRLRLMEVASMRRALLVLTVFALAGCVPVVNQRGYLADPAGEAAIKPGVDTETSVQARLGDPSTRATFGNDSWYYISSVERQLAFFDPKVQKRSIFAVRFDKDGKVRDTRHYSLDDGHVVAFESRTTPARGRELTFLQQLFNATPGVPIGTLSPNQQVPGQGPPP
jgi:outer membrane protein assembly factor BamE (lipoprotein component of BamABCDE complex)